jgi:hypothetical protein
MELSTSATHDRRASEGGAVTAAKFSAIFALIMLVTAIGVLGDAWRRRK